MPDALLPAAVCDCSSSCRIVLWKHAGCDRVWIPVGESCVFDEGGLLGSKKLPESSIRVVTCRTPIYCTSLAFHSMSKSWPLDPDKALCKTSFSTRSPFSTPRIKLESKTIDSILQAVHDCCIHAVGGMQAEKGESMWMVVGFEVMPCSIKREKGDTVELVKCNPWGDASNPEPQKIYEGADIIYTCASLVHSSCHPFGVA